MFAPRRILVTGASGFVGSHLLPMLRSAFPEAALYTNSFDVTQPDAVRDAVRTFAPDACVHLAGVATVAGARTDPDHAWAVNVQGTLNLARSVMAVVPGCVFLHISSAEIYGASFLPGTPLDEDALPAPMNDYAATKAAADLAVGALAAAGLRAVRVRPFNHTGPGQSPDFVVAAFACQIARIAAGLQEPTMRVGALDPMRDFLDVRDVCACYVACLQHAEDLPPGAIFNIASGTPRRVGDVLDALLKLAGVEPKIEIQPQLLRRQEITRATGNSAKARRLLGWEPKIAWHETLSDTERYWQKRVAQKHPG